MITNLPDQCYYEIGRPDLAKSVSFRLQLMGFPEDYLDGVDCWRG